MVYKHKFVRKVTKQGNASYYVIIPQEIVQYLKWREKQNVVVTEKGGKVIIEDWKNPSTKK